MVNWTRRARLAAWLTYVGLALLLVVWPATAQNQSPPKIGDERAIPDHWRDGQEFRKPLADIVAYGEKLFMANWTEEDGAGRPLTKGTGEPLSDRSQPLTGKRAFNRVSGPDANSCHGCHRVPFNRAGGSGDVTTIAFERADRYDFVTFDRKDKKPTRGSVDEHGRPATLDTVGNIRATPSLYGAGYIEMLARQMTEELRAIRDTVEPGRSKALVSKGVSFGTVRRRADGTWDTRSVEGLSRQSLVSSATVKPSLIVRPWERSGGSVSLRDVTSTSFNQHHGIQSTERFGVGTDPDGDGIANELTRADLSAIAIFQAAMPVPGRMIPNLPDVERAVLSGEQIFDRIRCTACHVPSLPLARKGWIYSEPNPYNPAGNLRRGVVPLLNVDLTDGALPSPRLTPSSGADPVVAVPAYTDLKLHDITDPADPKAADPLDMNEPAGSSRFAAGNRRFLTTRLWGVGNQAPYFHHGLFTTLRQAVMAHAGEALEQRTAFEMLTRVEQDAMLEFLKSLQVLPAGTESLIVDEHFQPKKWPPNRPAIAER